MKTRNYVAKHSRHKTGAGYHTSKKQYSRKGKMKDLDEQMEWAHKVLDLTDEEYKS